MGKVLAHIQKYNSEINSDFSAIENDYFVVHDNTFLEFLLLPENVELKKLVEEVLSFTSDKWLTIPLPYDDIGWGLSIKDLVGLSAENFVELLSNNDIAHEYDVISEGYTIRFKYINDTELFHATAVINQHIKSQKNYNNLSNIFKNNDYVY